MRITYDEAADAAYITFREREFPGEGETVRAQDKRCKVDLFVDIAANREIMGIEILNASRALPKSILDAADKLLPITDEEFELLRQSGA